jgi:hypothetical protein
MFDSREKYIYASLRQYKQAQSGAHPDSYNHIMDTGFLFISLKLNIHSYTSESPRILLAWYFISQRNNFASALMVLVVITTFHHTDVVWCHSFTNFKGKINILTSVWILCFRSSTFTDKIKR